MGIELWCDIAVGRRPRALHAELLEQEREGLLEIGADFRPNNLWEIPEPLLEGTDRLLADRKSTRLNSSHVRISYAVFCLKKKKNTTDLSPHLELVFSLLLAHQHTHN